MIPLRGALANKGYHRSLISGRVARTVRTDGRGNTPRVHDDGAFVAKDRPIAIRALKRFACGFQGRDANGAAVLKPIRNFETAAAGNAEEMAVLLRANFGGHLRPGIRQRVPIVCASPAGFAAAHGPGTLALGPSLGSRSKAVQQTAKWTVVISRRLPDGLDFNQHTSIDFAVWQGSQHESGARKLRPAWIPLVHKGEK